MLSGVVEEDESYVGGKPRKKNMRDDHLSTQKKDVVREGRVRHYVRDWCSGARWQRGYPDCRGFNRQGHSIVRDEHGQSNYEDTGIGQNMAYRSVRKLMPHGVVNHQHEYVRGPFHPNTKVGY